MPVKVLSYYIKQITSFDAVFVDSNGRGGRGGGPFYNDERYPGELQTPLVPFRKSIAVRSAASGIVKSLSAQARHPLRCHAIGGRAANFFISTVAVIDGSKSE